MEEYTAFEEILKWEVTEENQNNAASDENFDKTSNSGDATKSEDVRIKTALLDGNGPVADGFMISEKIQNGNIEKDIYVEDEDEKKLTDSIKIMEETGLEAFKGFDATIKKEVIQESQNMTATEGSSGMTINIQGDEDVEENEDVVVTDDISNMKNNKLSSENLTTMVTKEEKPTKRKRKNKPKNNLGDEGPKKLHLCKICKISFRKEKKLLKHMKKYHKEPNVNKAIISGETINESDRIEEILKVSSNLSDDIDALLGANIGEEVEGKDIGNPSKRIKLDEDPDVEEPFDYDYTSQVKPKTKRPKRTYFCPVCQMEFSKKKLMKLHSQIHEEKGLDKDMLPIAMLPKLFVCKMCYATFSEKDDFIRHSEEHRKDLDPMMKRKVFPCEICGATFTKKWNVKKHILIHSGEKKFECDICESKFATSSAKSAHMVIHTGTRPFKCQHCKAAFNQKGNLTKHMKIHTGEKPFKCFYCNASFNNSTHMKEHIMLHTGQKPHKCEICNLKFIKESSYKAHQQMHLGEKPYKCDLCGATFVLRLSYNMHMKRSIHSGDSQYKCKYCDLELTSEARFNNHIRKHEEPDKKHKCDLCYAEFVMKCSLIRHQKIHTGERPFKCTICEAQFAQKFSLTVHLRLHEGNLPFKCEICDAAYVTKSNYTSHMKLHNMSMDDSPLEDYQMSMANLANMTSMSEDNLTMIKNIAAEQMKKALKGSKYEAELGESFDTEEHANETTDNLSKESGENEATSSLGVKNKATGAICSEEEEENESSGEEKDEESGDIVVKEKEEHEETVSPSTVEEDDETSDQSEEEEEMIENKGINGLAVGENQNMDNVIKPDDVKTEMLTNEAKTIKDVTAYRTIHNEVGEPVVVKREINENEFSDNVEKFPNGIEPVVVKTELETDPDYHFFSNSH